MKSGIYPKMPEKDYRALSGLNYSSLADFNISQDHALMEKTGKSYFEFGNAFESLVEDRAKGTSKFTDRFFLADAPGEMPKDLAGWIEKEEDLKSKYKWNKPKKDGSVALSGTYVNRHLWLDECIKNPGMMPIGTDQIEILGKMIDNFMAMKPLEDIGVNETLEEILPVAQFQVPIIWYHGKMVKKALIDCMVETDTAVYMWDIKTAATEAKFRQMLSKRYWLQEIHYTAGGGHVYPGKDIHWRFLVSPKDEPWVAFPAITDPGSSGTCWSRYAKLCEDYQAWVDDGRPAKGWKELQIGKVWFN